MARVSFLSPFHSFLRPSLPLTQSLSLSFSRSLTILLGILSRQFTGPVLVYYISQHLETTTLIRNDYSYRVFGKAISVAQLPFDTVFEVGNFRERYLNRQFSVAGDGPGYFAKVFILWHRFNHVGMCPVLSSQNACFYVFSGLARSCRVIHLLCACHLFRLPIPVCL